jgi:hypothetical protein
MLCLLRLLLMLHPGGAQASKRTMETRTRCTGQDAQRLSQHLTIQIMQESQTENMFN